MKKYFYVVLVLFPIIILEIFLRLITIESDSHLRILNKPWYNLLPLKIPESGFFLREPIKNSYKVYDPVLGWKINKNIESHPYYSNHQGLRVSKNDISRKINLDSTEILTIGNSFTHGDEVLFKETWPFYLGKLSKRKVVNLGTSAYGIDQAILSYLISPIKTDIVILGLIPGDLERATSVVYPGIYYGGYKSKPIFSFKKDNKYQILNQPCLLGLDIHKELLLGEKSNFLKFDRNFDEKLFINNFFDFLYFNRIKKMFLYRKNYIAKPIYISPETDNYKYILKIYKIFYNECLEKEDFPIISLLDNNNSFSDRIKYEDPWKNLTLDLKKIGFKVIEPSDSLPSLFKEEKNKVINSDGVHYTPIANKIVARHIYNSF